MKKTILALTVTSIFSGAAIASIDNDVKSTDLYKNFKIVEQQDGSKIVVNRSNNAFIADVVHNDSGKILAVDVSGNSIEVDLVKRNYTITGEDFPSINGNIVEESERNNDQNNHDAEREKAKAEDAKKRHEWEQKRRDNASMNDQNNHDAEREKAQAEDEARRIEHERNKAQAEDEARRIEHERNKAQAEDEARRIEHERNKAQAEDEARRIEHERNKAQAEDEARRIEHERNAAKADALEAAINTAIDQNKEIVIDGVTYSDKELFEAKNMLASMSKDERVAAIKQLEKDGANSDIKIVDGKSNGGSNDAMEIEGAINEAVEAYNADISAAQSWAAQAEAEFKQEIARLDSKIDTMEGRVSNGTAMVGAMSQMQFSRDGLGLGAGVAEFNGSRAVAVGVGYAFGAEKQWMAKGSFGYAESKKGKGSKDTMAAAGLTYSFK